jgi:hypothetical protein
MREAVVGQILAFKRARSDTGQLRCAVTGTSLTWHESHVDHLPPGFAALADAFAETAGGYARIPLVPSSDGMIGRPLEPPFDHLWTAYHGQHARLQLLSVPAHLALTTERRRGR